MITRRPRRPIGTLSSYIGLVRYLLDPKNTLERVGRVTVINCHSDDPMVAALEVYATQELNRRAQDDKTYHFYFSFRHGEYPQSEVLLDCERELCRALGFEEHQRVSVVHRDTDNLHVHVAVNKIHPTRLTIHTPFNDYWVRTQGAKRLEIKHNLQRDRHEPRDPDDGPTGGAADMEHQSGIESFAGWIQRVLAEDLCRASSWAELHRFASEHGLHLRRRGNGCVITQGAYVVRASSVRRELSLHALQKRLGPFEPAEVSRVEVTQERGVSKPELGPERPRASAPPPHLRGKQERLADLIDERDAALSDELQHQRTNERASEAQELLSKEERQERSEAWTRLIAELSSAASAGPRVQAARAAIAAHRRGYAREPLNRTAEANHLYKQFLRERAERAVTRRDRGDQLRRAQKAEFDRLLTRWRFRRAALRLVTGTRAEKHFMFAAVRLAMQQELKALRARGASDRRLLAHATKRLAWADWLQVRAREGDLAALEQLRRRETAVHAVQTGPRAIAGAARSAQTPPPQAAIDQVTKNGAVIYRGALAGVRDDGHQLRVQGRVSHAVLAEALRVAANRYGDPLRVEGDDAFRQAVVDVVVARNIRVTFDDGELEARRSARQPMETLDERTELRRHSGPSQVPGRSGPPGPKTAAARQEAGENDRVRNVRARELVRDGSGAERVLPSNVSADLASRAQQDHRALRRPAGAARRVNAGPPPFRRGRLETLSALQSPTARASTTSMQRPPAAMKVSRKKDYGGPRPVAPRTALPSLETNAKAMPSARAPLTAAVSRYVAEREAKRARGIGDVLPHASFDGRGGEFTFVGRRNIDGHVLVLLRENTRIIVLPASAQTTGLRSGDRVTLSADGHITGHSRTPRR